MKLYPPVCPTCGGRFRTIVEGVLLDAGIKFVEERCIECDAELGQPHEEDCKSLLNEGAPPLVTRDDIPDDAGTYEDVDEDPGQLCWDTSEPWIEDGYASVTCVNGHAVQVELADDEDDEDTDHGFLVKDDGSIERDP